MQDKLFNMLFEEDEVTWQTMIYELVRSEQMDPWDIDLKHLSGRFLEMVKTLKKLDFRISGKIILAAAILLRLKSTKLLEDDISNLNRLIAMSEESDDDFFEEISDEDGMNYNKANFEDDKFRLIPKTPQPRKRKVSVFDLVDALQKALEIKKRRINFHIPETKFQAPEKKKDISIVIKEIYEQIKEYFISQKIEKMTFSELLPTNSRSEKVYTFMPLLYLENLRKIDLFQEQHLADFDISLTKPSE